MSLPWTIQRFTWATVSKPTTSLPVWRPMGLCGPRMSPFRILARVKSTAATPSQRSHGVPQGRPAKEKNPKNLQTKKTSDPQTKKPSIQSQAKKQPIQPMKFQPPKKHTPESLPAKKLAPQARPYQERKNPSNETEQFKFPKEYLPLLDRGKAWYPDAKIRYLIPTLWIACGIVGIYGIMAFIAPPLDPVASPSENGSNPELWPQTTWITPQQILQSTISLVTDQTYLSIGLVALMVGLHYHRVVRGKGGNLYYGNMHVPGVGRYWNFFTTWTFHAHARWSVLLANSFVILWTLPSVHFQQTELRQDSYHMAAFVICAAALSHFLKYLAVPLEMMMLSKRSPLLAQAHIFVPTVGAGGAACALLAALCTMHAHDKMWIISSGVLPMRVEGRHLLGFTVLFEIARSYWWLSAPVLGRMETPIVSACTLCIFINADD